MNLRKLLCVAALLCAAFALVAASDKGAYGKCRRCKFGCSIRNNNIEKCMAKCDQTACSDAAFKIGRFGRFGSQSDSEFRISTRPDGTRVGCLRFKKNRPMKKIVRPVADEEMSDSRVNIKNFFSKCQLCKTGCAFVKNSEKCVGVCEATVCSSAQADSALHLTKPKRCGRYPRRVPSRPKKQVLSASDSELVQRPNKCRLCLWSCPRREINHVAELAKCKELCSDVCRRSTFMSDDEVEKKVKKVKESHGKKRSLPWDFGRKKVSDKKVKIGRFFRKNKCKICKARCAFVKNSDKCTAICNATACSGAQTNSAVNLTKPKRRRHSYGRVPSRPKKQVLPASDSEDVPMCKICGRPSSCSASRMCAAVCVMKTIPCHLLKRNASNNKPLALADSEFTQPPNKCRMRLRKCVREAKNNEAELAKCKSRSSKGGCERYSFMK